MKMPLLEGLSASQARALQAGGGQATNSKVGLLLYSGRKPGLK